VQVSLASGGAKLDNVGFRSAHHVIPLRVEYRAVAVVRFVELGHAATDVDADRDPDRAEQSHRRQNARLPGAERRERCQIARDNGSGWCRAG
jgi:hypothetical protein